MVLLKSIVVKFLDCLLSWLWVQREDNTAELSCCLCQLFARYLHLSLYGKQIHTWKRTDWLLFHLCSVFISVSLQILICSAHCEKSCTVTRHRHTLLGLNIKRSEPCNPLSSLNSVIKSCCDLRTTVFCTFHAMWECTELELTGDLFSHLRAFSSCTVPFSHIGSSHFSSNTLTCS